MIYTYCSSDERISADTTLSQET